MITNGLLRASAPSGATPTVSSSPVSSWDEYRSFLTNRAKESFALPEITVYKDASGKEVSKSDLEKAGYDYRPGVAASGMDNEGTTEGIYKRGSDPEGSVTYGSTPDSGYSVGKRKATWDDLGGRGVEYEDLDGNKHAAGRTEKDELLYGKDRNQGLVGKSVELPDKGADFQNQYAKLVNKDASIDPHYARLFAQMDNYHEGRFLENVGKDPAVGRKLAGDTIKQWAKDAKPGTWDKILDTASNVAAAFVGGMIGGPVGSAAMLTAKNGGNLESFAKNAFSAWVGGQVAGKIAPSLEAGPIVPSAAQATLGNAGASVLASAAGGATSGLIRTGNVGEALRSGLVSGVASGVNQAAGGGAAGQVASTIAGQVLRPKTPTPAPKPATQTAVTKQPTTTQQEDDKAPTVRRAGIVNPMVFANWAMG